MPAPVRRQAAPPRTTCATCATCRSCSGCCACIRGCRLCPVSSKCCHSSAPPMPPSAQAPAGAPAGGCSRSTRCPASVCQVHRSISCASCCACCRAACSCSTWRWRLHSAPTSSAAPLHSSRASPSSGAGSSPWPATSTASTTAISAVRASSSGTSRRIGPGGIRGSTQGGARVGLCGCSTGAGGRSKEGWQTPWHRLREGAACQRLYESGLCRRSPPQAVLKSTCC